MIKKYISIIKKYPLIILSLGFTYGSTIIFTFFGPILTITAGQLAPTISIIAVIFHVIGFFLKPIRNKKRTKYFYGCLIILLPLIIFFHISPKYLKIITTMIYAFIIGRIGCYWTYTANNIIPDVIRGKVISASLFTSFLTLYLVNISLPLFSINTSLLLPAVMLSTSIILYIKMIQKYDNIKIQIKKHDKGDINPYAIFVFLIVIYIAGGFSYAGIYPSFRYFTYIDRYYNVFFYLIAIILAGIILDKYGRKIAFTLGVALLGISFTFFIMPSTVVTYIITQTFLQSGWAFVNAFGWSFSWDMAKESKKDILFPRGIASMLLGAAIGAFLAVIFENMNIAHSLYGVVTFIPLFVSIVFLVFFPETLKLNKEKKVHFNEFKQIKELQVLTPRELEVCYHLINGFSNEKISNELFISENTVKTHISRIYSKLYISSRTELKSKISVMILDLCYISIEN